MGWGQGKFGWGTFGSDAPTYGVLDTEVLGNVQMSLLEPNNGGASFQSGVWTQAQAVAALTNRQRKFLSETGITIMVAYQTGEADKRRYDLPDNVIDVRRVAWANQADPSAYVELPRADGWELDHGKTGWPTSSATVPETYVESHTPSLVIEVVPAPTDLGEIELTASADGMAPTGAGIPLSIPDDFTPYLAWGVRADLLSAEYEGNDPDRAAHCEERFAEGIELARILVSGGV